MNEGWNVEFAGAVARLTINRPSNLNALNTAMLRNLDQILDDLHRKDGLRVVEVTGAGERAFIAGADIDEMQGMDAAAARALIELGHRAFTKLEALPVPVVAVLNGHTLGGGLELALCADFRIASANAKLGLPEIKLGVSAGWGGPYRLARLVGAAPAKDMFFRGRLLTAGEALALGLATEVYPTVPELRAAAAQLVAELAEKAPLAMRVAKQTMHNHTVLGHGLDPARDALIAAYLFRTADAEEGIKAFKEKRPPMFSGR